MNEKFPFSVKHDVRLYEVDFLAHVNNAVYQNWIDHARFEAFKTINNFNILKKYVFPVRHIEIDYLAGAILGDTVEIKLWPKKIGNTSVTLEYKMVIVDSDDSSRINTIVLSAKQISICIDPGIGKVPVPDEIRAHFPIDV